MRRRARFTRATVRCDTARRRRRSPTKRPEPKTKRQKNSAGRADGRIKREPECVPSRGEGRARLDGTGRGPIADDFGDDGSSLVRSRTTSANTRAGLKVDLSPPPVGRTSISSSRSCRSFSPQTRAIPSRGATVSQEPSIPPVIATTTLRAGLVRLPYLVRPTLTAHLRSRRSPTPT